MKKTERVFLLVYCSGHGVTWNCKQVYLLNEKNSKAATFNIENKLRWLVHSFDNFCHIFAIYDLSEKNIKDIPELLEAVRGAK